jgi:putative DNA primase/helicase
MQNYTTAPIGARAAHTISWAEIENITHGRLGRTMSTCPTCSEGRRTPLKRKSKVLAVTLVEPEFAVYYCNHCDAKGFSYPETPSRAVDLTELQRRRDEATRHAAKEKQSRSQQALALWNEAQPFRGTPAEDYLVKTRNIGDWLDTFAFLDQVFRFHPSCPFGGERLACMVALVRDIKTDTPIAIHRTALTAGEPQRIGRMSLGPVAGGAIKISPNFEVHSGLMIGEGIETVLSASKYYSFKPVWSVIDAGNLAKFPVLSGIESVSVAVDSDDAGQNAAAECVKRLTHNGIEVSGDFNDFIRGHSCG